PGARACQPPGQVRRGWIIALRCNVCTSARAAVSQPCSTWHLRHSVTGAFRHRSDAPIAHAPKHQPASAPIDVLATDTGTPAGSIRTARTPTATLANQTPTPATPLSRSPGTSPITRPAVSGLYLQPAYTMVADLISPSRR